MNEAWDKFENTWNGVKAKVGNMKATDATSLREDIKKSLKQIWKMEESIEDSVAAAADDGVDGKKPKDFAGNSDYASDVKDWQDAVSDHTKLVSDLEKVSLEARGYLKDLKKEYEAALKSLKAAKLDKDTKNPKFKDFKTLKEQVKGELAKLETIEYQFSSLKLPEVLYGKKGFEKKKLEAMVKAGLKEAKGAAELPKILEQKVRQDNAKLAQEVKEGLTILKTKVTEANGDKKAVAELLKEGAKSMAKLKKLSAGYLGAEKKMSDEINKSPEKDAIKKLIKDMAETEKSCRNLLKEATRLGRG